MDGLVLYTDGSFRDNKAGWGIHGYSYEHTPPSAKANLKLQPTIEGYKDVTAAESVTVIKYIDSFGRILGKGTNNIAELQAAIESFKAAVELNPPNLLLLMDSEYVIKGLTQYIPKWIKSNWVSSKGTPVANKEYWIELKRVSELYQGKYIVKWVKGHSDNLGNDNADRNALRGIGLETDIPVMAATKGVVINKLKKVQEDPLILETRMLFEASNNRQVSNTYYFYDLAKNSIPAPRPSDTKKDALVKVDLLLGRRISDATYCVYIAEEPIEYLDLLMDIHNKEYGSDQGQLGIVHLANASNANTRQQIESLGVDGLIKFPEPEILSTPDLGLISRTLNPPRLANEAIDVFKIMQRRLQEYLDGKLGENIVLVDITDLLYDTVIKGKQTVRQLKKSITSNTRFIEVPFEYKGLKSKLRMVLTIDLPQRNKLSRLTDPDLKVEVMIIPHGLRSYSFSTVFVTESGKAIYSNPYTQFILN